MTARQFTVTLPAETCSLRSLRSFVASLLEGLQGLGDADRIVLAVDEACSNVIKYRCKTIDNGRIELVVDVDDELVRFRLRRFCTTADVGKVRPRDLADVRPGGLGTSFIGQVMDRVEFEQDPSGQQCVALVMEKKLGERG